MIFAVAVFGVGSAICGWANSGAVLVFGRIVQGLGTGGIDLYSEVILSDLVPLRQRGSYMSIKHCMFALGTTVGPLLGGVFAEHGWRWCFWVNLPVCGVSIALLSFWLRVGGGVKSKEVSVRKELRKLDGVGASLLTVAVVLILSSLSMGGASHAWSEAAIITPLVIGLILLVVFPFWECSKYCKYPIMPPHIFANRTAFTLTAIHGFLTYGMQFYLPPFFQGVKGSSPTVSGIQVLPTTLVIVVMAAVGGPLLSRFGKYRPIHQAGFACLTLALGLYYTMERGTPVHSWVLLQILAAFGSGIVVPTLLPSIIAELPDSANGAAAGSWAFLRGTGSLFGVAVPGAIFNLRFGQLLSSISSEDARKQLDKGQAYQRASAEFVSKFGEKAEGEIIQVFTKSLKSVWIVFAVLAGIGFLFSLGERQVKMRRQLDTAFGLKSAGSPAASEKGKAASRDGGSQEEKEGDGLVDSGSNAGMDERDVDLEKQALAEERRNLTSL